jgi:hypothetical protein
MASGQSTGMVWLCREGCVKISSRAAGRPVRSSRGGGTESRSSQVTRQSPRAGITLGRLDYALRQAANGPGYSAVKRVEPALSYSEIPGRQSEHRDLAVQCRCLSAANNRFVLLQPAGLSLPAGWPLFCRSHWWSLRMCRRLCSNCSPARRATSQGPRPQSTPASP